jgi:hypothetical protein
MSPDQLLSADLQNGKDPGDCDRHQKENLLKASETTLALHSTSSLVDPVLQTSDRRENALHQWVANRFWLRSRFLIFLKYEHY